MTDQENDREALRKHIRDNHPSVYLTLVSIIVALALEDLFSLVRDIYGVGVPETGAVLLWLRIVGAFGAALSVWVGYCHILITTRWILGIWDALSVMSLLIILFVINTTVGAENPAWWFFAMGTLPLAGGFILNINLRRAATEPGVFNDALPAPNNWLIYFSICLACVNLLFGLLVITAAVGALATELFAVVVVVAVISWSFLWIGMWRKSVGLP
jgi:hypothetical protein